MDMVVCSVAREADIYVTLVRARSVSQSLGLSNSDSARVDLAVLELSRNILLHAGRGQMSIKRHEDQGQRGIIIEAQDTGPGIPDIELALSDGYSTTKTLGAGLPGVRRLMDQFEIESSVGRGTFIRAVKWCQTLRQPQRARYQA